MPKISVRNMSGAQVGDLDLKPEVFEVEPNVPLMHQAVVTENANARQGTSSTKTRGDVSGGGAKPFRQKGTGRARQGSIRAPHYYHGGIVFGPHPKSYEKTMPKKMKRGALRSAWSARAADDVIIVVDEIKMDKISTKEMVSFLSSVEAAGKTLVVLDKVTEEIYLSSRNIPRVNVRVAPGVSVRDIMNADTIIMTRDAVAKLEEVLS